MTSALQTPQSQPKSIGELLAKKLVEHTVPYTDLHLKAISAIANFRTLFFQNILFFHHNHFEIRFWADPFTPIKAGEMEKMTAAQIEPLYLQGIALYRMALSLGITFIDFKRCCLLPGDILQFAVFFPPAVPPERTKENTLKEVLHLFQGNPAFTALSEANYLDYFYRLSGRYTFTEEKAYLYTCDDFAAAVLHHFPLTRVKNGANIRIHIKTPGVIPKQMAKADIITHVVWPAETVFLIDIGGEEGETSKGEPLHQTLARLIPGLTPSAPDDYITIIDQLSLFMQQSSFTALLLLVDHLNTRQDAEFLNYLLDIAGYPYILLVCFDVSNGLFTFDLELNENPVNWIAEYLGYSSSALDDEEVRLLKTIAGIPVPIPWERLAAIFSSLDVARIESLVLRKKLRVIAGKVVMGNSLPILHNDFVAQVDEALIRAVFSTEAAAYPGMRISYLIQAGLWDELKTTLAEYLDTKTGFDVEIANLETLLSKNPAIIPGNIEILALLLAVVVEGNHTAAAHRLIDQVEIEQLVKDKSPYGCLFLLSAARLCHVEKNHRDMVKWLERALTQSGGNIPESYADIYHFLKFLCNERQMDKEAANLQLRALKSELYRHRAAVLLSDRYIYRGDYPPAEKILHEAAHFFHHHRFSWDEVDIGLQLAKLARERGDFTEAEKSYKNLFLKSEMKNYALLSANICIDLGNLYWLQDYYHGADTWYRKALVLFRHLDNKNGINTAISNLAEIEKINGNWEETKQSLEAILNYDKECGTAIAVAVDYFNIGQLEYLKHNITDAMEFIEKASVLFKQKENKTFLLECEFLKLHLHLLRSGSSSLDLSELKKLGTEPSLSHDQKIVLAVLEIIMQDVQLVKGSIIAEKIALCSSSASQYQLLAAVLHRYPSPELLEMLKTLSISLSKETKNYYFYEYYYLYYSHFYCFGTVSLARVTSGDNPLSDEERKRFMDVYYFFLRNGRVLAPGIIKNKQWLDEREAVSHLFKKAEWVEGYRTWQVPEDFFNQLLLELQRIMSIDLIRLAVYEHAHEYNPTQVGEENVTPIFDFNKVSSGSLVFRELTTEIMQDAFIHLEPVTLTVQNIKKRYSSKEKAFYTFTLTRVLLWKLSNALFAVLLVASDEAVDASPNFFQQYKGFFQEFGALIQRYYETVYQLNKQLNFIIGESQAVHRLKEQILKISKVDFSLLIRGESGSGKELVAKAVHLLSQRARQPFVPVNAAAIPENLLEAELFGYKKGAFTGANENKIGLIESANGGTLFLDEIADLPLSLQAKMLRVLQEREIRRLGENKTIVVDIRFVCATNKDLRVMIGERLFREDFFFRLQDLTIIVPPLRERVEDIPLLVAHFLKKYGFSITDKSELQRIYHYFMQRSWPGNIRELESSVKRLITYYPDFESDSSIFVSPSNPQSLIVARDHFEERIVRSALEDCHGNKSEAAALLQITRQYLFKLIKKYKINPAAKIQ